MRLCSKRAFSLVLALLSVIVWSGAFADAPAAEKIFRVGQPLTLFERDGLTVRLTGEIFMLNTEGSFARIAEPDDQNASLALAVTLENNSAKALFIEYAGTVNGVSLGGAPHPLVNIHRIEAGGQTASFVLFDKSWLGGRNPDPLQSCSLTFRVYEKPSDSNGDNILLYKQPAGTIRFDLAPGAGKVFRTGQALTVLDENGVRVDLSYLSVGSAYLLLGGSVTNHSGKTVSLSQQCHINGWSLGGYRNGVVDSRGKELSSIAPDAGPVSVCFPSMLTLSWQRIHSQAEVESFELVFRVSAVGRSGKTEPWFSASSGTVWVNRTVEAESTAAPAAESVKTESAEAEKAPEEAPSLFGSGLRFGDSEKTVRETLSAGGIRVRKESGALHTAANLFPFPKSDEDYDLLFSDEGRLNCVRRIYFVERKQQADSVYQAILALLTETWGSPNGMGSSYIRGSVQQTLTGAMAAFMNDVYCKTYHHDMWYIKTDACPVKIDLFYEEAGNTAAGTKKYVLEFDIEGIGI